MDIHIYDKEHTPEDKHSKSAVADFLYEHLDEFGDDREYIKRAIDYAFAKAPGQDGFMLVGEEDGDIVGVVVMNETGMSGYIPENILVYIAVHQKMRGKGAGKQLMQAAIERAKGDVALHVEPENPAVHLYKKVGFTNKYLEMRYKRKS